VKPAWAVAAAACFVWLGMVLAISFIEAPLKFRAPGVTVQLGLGIGRLVFRALNAVECVLAVIALVAVLVWAAPTGATAALLAAALALAVQVLVVRRWLNRRSDAVLAGEDSPTPNAGRRSRGHFVYIGLELLKVIALLASGSLLLAA
jgi:hypothetical protein